MYINFNWSHKWNLLFGWDNKHFFLERVWISGSLFIPRIVDDIYLIFFLEW